MKKKNVAEKRDRIYIIHIAFVIRSNDENWKPHKLSQTFWPTLPITTEKYQNCMVVEKMCR